MSKYKYRLVEQEEGGEEESGLKQLKAKSELVLTSEKYNADQLLDIINNPDNLEGVFVSKAGGLTDLEKQVFGDKPNLRANYQTNREIYKQNGKDLYRKIAQEVGGFQKGTPASKKDAEGNVEFFFPEKSKYNLDLVKKYYAKISGEQAVKSSLNPTKVDDRTLKFELKDRSVLDKILKNAKLVPTEDFNLEKRKSLEEYNVLREKINKILKNV